MNEIGSYIRDARERRGVSRALLSRKSMVPETSIEAYERGRALPGIFNLLCIADSLGVSLDELVGRGVSASRPLTVDDLSLMDDEPIWVVNLKDNSGEWCVFYIDVDYLEEAVALRAGTSSAYSLKDYNKTWTAYRTKQNLK